MESKKVQFFNRLSFGTLLATLSLALFFFIPYVPVTLDASKGFLLAIGVTVAFFFWLIARLGEGKFSIPKDRIILYGAAIPVVFLVASFFSSSRYISLFGSGFEIGTFGSMLIFFILFFLSSIYFQTERKLWYFFRFLFLGATVLAVFELINMFIGVDRFAPGLLKGVVAGNLVGSWNDFALVFGLVVLLVLLTVEFLRTKGPFLVMQYFLLVSGLLFLIIINLPLVWILVGAFSIIIFVYSISIQQAGIRIIHGGGDRKKFPFTALIVVFVCLVFLIGNNSLGGLIAKYASVPNGDIRPLATTTAQIAYKSILHNPFFGTGPNTFTLDWALWQPKAVAQSAFWNIDFTNGYSSLMTFAVTTGLLGVAAWLLFLVTFFRRMVKSLRTVLKNPLSNYFTMMTLTVSVYSWIVLLLFTPNVIMYILAFVSSGMLVGILVYNQTLQVKELSFLEDPRHSFFSILGLMALMILTLSTTYLYAEKFASVIYFSRGSVASDTTLPALSKSQRMLSNAALLDQSDIYYRALSQVYIAEINTLLNDKTISQDVLKSNVQQLVTLAENSAQGAVSQNPKQYQNYVNQGNMYSSLVPLGIDKSYESAVAAYDKARALAPNNPSILLSRATLEMAHKSDPDARKFIDQALLLKNDYTDAIFLLAQIETNEGNLNEAIKQAERAAIIAPNDQTVFFRLGLLRYNNTDYTGAVSAFERAVIIDPTYLNARFFLGESYAKVGRKDDALVQFRILEKALPDNEDVKNAISSLTGTLAVPTTPAASTTTPKTPAKGTTTQAKPPLPGQH